MKLKKYLQNKSLILVIVVIAIVTIIQISKKEERPDIDTLIENTIAILKDNPYVEFNYNIEFEGFLKTTEKSISGIIKIAPVKKRGAYPFSSVHILADEIFELSIINNTVYYHNYNEKDIVYSPLHRLGAPLFSMRVKNTNLLYQYLGVLQDYKELSPKLGTIKLIDGENCQEIIFDLPQYDFYVRFWINYKTFEVKRIVGIEKKESEVGKTIYNIENFVTNKDKQPDEFFDLSKSKTLDLKEYSNGGPIIGNIAPIWSLNNLEKTKIIDLDQLKGKILVLDFWATWCAPCKKAMPEINALHNEYKNQLVEFIGITYMEKGDPLAFIKSKGYSYTFLEGNNEVGTSYGLDKTGLPAVFIIDQLGRIAEFESGYNENESIERIRRTVNKLLKDDTL